MDRVLVEIGRGHRIAFNILNIGRFKLGAGAFGAARECLRVAVEYARDRKQIGRAIIEFGIVQRKIADMATRLYATEAVAYRTAGLLDRANPDIPDDATVRRARLVDVIEDHSVECSIVKLFGTECLDEVADESLQILRGYGFLKDCAVERHYRDSRIDFIFEGTNEISRLIIPATLFKRASRGTLPYFDYVAAVRERLDALSPVASSGAEPLGVDIAAVENAKPVVAWAAELLVKRNLQDLANRRQHLEIPANLSTDLFAAESVVCRTRKLLKRETSQRAANELDLTRIFVASANERIGDGARRLAANELEGEPLRQAFGEILHLTAFLPIATIDAKTRITIHIAEGKLRFLD